MAACRRLVASCVLQLFGSGKNEFHEDDGSSVEDLAHCCCAAVGPLPPTPSIWYFLISEEQVGSWAASGLSVRGLLSCSSLFFAGCVWPLGVQRKIGNLAVSMYPP